MAHQPKLGSRPFSLRLTFAERAKLEHAAGDQPLGSYIKDRALDEDRPPPKRRKKRPVKDHKELARVMAMLGDARLASNVNQLARNSNSGASMCDPDSKAQIKRASDDIRFIRNTLLKALGIYEGAP